MRQANQPPKTVLQKLLDGVETVGNKVPHPAVIFLALIGIVVLLSHVFYVTGTRVSYQRINPQTHAIEDRTAAVKSLLTADGIRFLLTSAVRNFLNFGPVGVILVAMVGVGLAEQAGLIGALIHKLVNLTPRRAITFIVVFLGICSSVASDAGYLVLIPLGAGVFLSLGRHPVAGLAAAFSGVGAVFGVNLLITPIDGILTEITNDAIHLLNPAYSIDLTANLYFAIVSSLVLCVVCTVITEKLVEPRLGEYHGEVPGGTGEGVSGAEEESRGLAYALYALLGVVVVLSPDAATGGSAAPSGDGRHRRQLTVHGQPDRADHVGLPGDGPGVWHRRTHHHEQRGRHQRHYEIIRQPERSHFAVFSHQPVHRLFQLQQHGDRCGREDG
jgi:aminobenzoyl-glutamate transport protein